jgi:hypothetical protein
MVELAYKMTCLRVPKCVVKEAVKIKARGLGVASMSPRTFERLMSRVRERLEAESGKTRREMRGESARFYEAVIADAKTPTREKIRAQEALDKLFGLPITRIIHTGTGDGGAVKVEQVGEAVDLSQLSKEELLKLRELRAKASSRHGGAGGGAAGVIAPAAGG